MSTNLSFHKKTRPTPKIKQTNKQTKPQTSQNIYDLKNGREDLDWKALTLEKGRQLKNCRSVLYMYLFRCMCMYLNHLVLKEWGWKHCVTVLLQLQREGSVLVNHRLSESIH